jgi:hypothetical protein
VSASREKCVCACRSAFIIHFGCQL